jgi:lipoate-protein ligase B
MRYKIIPNFVKYKNGLAVQKCLVELKQMANTDKSKDIMLLLEHYPTYTAGRRVSDHSNAARLVSLGADYFPVLRGGQITFHGPGQLIAYPIMNVHDMGGVEKYVCGLEQLMISTCKDCGVNNVGRGDFPGSTGIWVGDSKIGAIGVHISRNITSHGIAINSNVDLKWFSHIVPCGLTGKNVTSILKETGKTLEMEKLCQLVLQNFSIVFGREMEKLEDVDPTLNDRIDQMIKE